jgi:hypothetical protein
MYKCAQFDFPLGCCDHSMPRVNVLNLSDFPLGCCDHSIPRVAVLNCSDFPLGCCDHSILCVTLIMERKLLIIVGVA